MKMSIATLSGGLVLLALAVGARAGSERSADPREQEKQIVRGTTAAPRIGGITKLNYSSSDGDLRVLGSVYVGPPVVLMEAVSPYPEGETVVPISYSFLFLQDSEWRKTSDAMYFRRPAETDIMSFSTRVRSADATGADDGHWEVEVSIRPRDGLLWSEIRIRDDINVSVEMSRQH